MSYDRDAALDQLAEWESDTEMEKYYADEYDKGNKAMEYAIQKKPYRGRDSDD
jgi:hypothetical protein